MLRLAYPDLDEETRANVWQTMFERAGLKLEGQTFADLAAFDLNGRQIRNLTRLAKILNPNGAVSDSGMKEVIEFGTDDLPAVGRDSEL